MAEEALLKEYKFDTLNVLLPSAFDQIEVSVEYIIYNTLFLQECIKDFNRAYASLSTCLQDAEKRQVANEVNLNQGELYLYQDRDELIKESHNAINDCLDGLREILRNIAGLKGLVDDLKYKGSKKQVVDINDVLLNLILALKQKWSSESELSMELDSRALPLECVRSNLYCALAMTLLYSIRFLSKQVPESAKRLLLIKTTTLESHYEITIVAKADIDNSPEILSSLEANWQRDLRFLKWIIASEYGGDIKVYRNRINMCKTVITLPIP